MKPAHQLHLAKTNLTMVNMVQQQHQQLYPVKHVVEDNIARKQLLTWNLSALERPSLPTDLDYALSRAMALVAHYPIGTHAVLDA